MKKAEIDPPAALRMSIDVYMSFVHPSAWFEIHRYLSKAYDDQEGARIVIHQVEPCGFEGGEG
jgi:hypothetical protein